MTQDQIAAWWKVVREQSKYWAFIKSQQSKSNQRKL